MSLGLPILCPLSGATRVLIEESKIGLYYREGDAQGLEEAIITLSTNKSLREQMADACRSLHKDQFNHDTVFNNFLTFIKTLVS